MTKKKQKYISKTDRALLNTTVGETIDITQVGDNLPVNKNEYVVDHAGIRPNGYVVEMPEVQTNDTAPLELLTLIFDCMEALDKMCGKHPEYSNIHESLNAVRLSLNQVTLDVAGNVQRDDYKDGVQPSNVSNILISGIKE